MKRGLLLFSVIALAAGCGGQAQYVDLPPYRGYLLDDLLRRLHASGLRAAYPATRAPCGDGLPAALIPSPRAPARVRKGSTVRLKLASGSIPSPAVPLHHPRWTRVPALVGQEFEDSRADLVGVWPCIQVRAERSTAGIRLIVVAQDPSPGTRVRAYGVLTKRGYRVTTVRVTVAAAP